VSERGLPATVREYLDAYEDRHAVSVNLEGEDVARGLPALIAFQLLRIIQEALANVRKHAAARNAWITFSKSDEHRIQMVIGDDGCGFDPDAVSDTPPTSFGLAGMRERVESLGGVLTVESQPGAGTRIVVDIPLKGGVEVSRNGSLSTAPR